MKDELLSVIESGLREANDGTVAYEPTTFLTDALFNLWNPRVAHSVDTSRIAEEAQSYREALRANRPPPWFLGMSSAFAKQISKIDRKLQGRILEALVEITGNPEQLRGDTMKPLVGELKGCWRYRLADYRIIYSANKATGDITLLAFAPRGSAYAP
jgi:mRNA-degrading endonuclease RelE of RelBE toxin-antitoxin system